MTGRASPETLHPRLLSHDRLATAIEDSIRRDRQLALLCLEGTEAKRLDDLESWPAWAVPGTFERDGLTFVILEHQGPDMPELDSCPELDGVKPLSGVGIAVFPRDANDPDGLCRVAAAMERSDVRDLRRSEDAFPVDRPANRLDLHYQPQIELESGCVIAAEALARQPGNDRTAAVADPAMVAANTLGGTDFWALERVARDLARWRERGCPEIIVAINLSLEQAMSPGLPRTIEEMLAVGALSPDCLEIELTEHAPCLDHAAASAAVDAVRASGVRLALDDFGTGFSSLSLFDCLSLDTLKIDRTFVAGLSDPANAGDAEWLIRDIIALAGERGLRSVAEGVENETQLEALKRLGCDICQGYLFSPPLPGESLGDLLASGTDVPWRAGDGKPGIRAVQPK